jgi:hypothetical protein
LSSQRSIVSMKSIIITVYKISSQIVKKKSRLTAPQINSDNQFKMLPVNRQRRFKCWNLPLNEENSIIGYIEDTWLKLCSFIAILLLFISSKFQHYTTNTIQTINDLSTFQPSNSLTSTFNLELQFVKEGGSPDRSMVLTRLICITVLLWLTFNSIQHSTGIDLVRPPCFSQVRG